MNLPKKLKSNDSRSNKFQGLQHSLLPFLWQILTRSKSGQNFRLLGFLTSFLFLILFKPTAAGAVSIQLDGTSTLVSGTDCNIATYRFGSPTTYEGQALDILVEVLAEENDLLDQNPTGEYCITPDNNSITVNIADRAGDGNTFAFMDLKVTVVAQGTTTPVEVDRLAISAFDLDINDLAVGGSDTDDVYFFNPDGAYISNITNVTPSTGNFFGGQYNVKLKGQSGGDCDDTPGVASDPTCRGGGIFINGDNGVNTVSSVQLRVQNDDAFSTRTNNTSLRRFQLSLEIGHLEELITNNTDFGDANSSYGSGGTSVSTNLSLGYGAIPDNETADQFSANATGDDIDTVSATDFDDEDGVRLNNQPLDNQSLESNKTTNLDVTTFGTGFLSGWLDLNGDGDFGDAGEQVVDDLAINSSTVTTSSVPIAIPASAVAGNTKMRFRFSETENEAATGLVSNGEVEDYQVEIASPPPTTGATPQTCPAGLGDFAEWVGNASTTNKTGTGSFTASGNNLPALPNFNYAVTGDVGNSNTVVIDNAEIFDGTNQFEPIYGDAEIQSNLNVRSPSNTSGVNNTIDRTTLTTITFDETTPASGWGFLLLDIDDDQATIMAKDANGNVVPDAVIDSWFIEVFDAAPNANNNTDNDSDRSNDIPIWDSANVTAVSQEGTGAKTNIVRNPAYIVEAPAIWFQPNIPLSELSIQFESVTTNDATYHLYLASCLGEKDYGDAPEDLSSIDVSLNPAYPTSNANNGARHNIDNTTYLGAGVDSETDGQPSLDADGDNDDGVTFPTAGTDSILIVDENNTITVEASIAGVLNAWIDWNQDGDWDDTGEQIATNEALTAGSNSLTINPAVEFPHGQTYARFRFSSQSDLEPTGIASDGEVEDYTVHLLVKKPDGCNPVLINHDFESLAVGESFRIQGGTGVSFSIYREAQTPGWSFRSANPSAGGNFDQRNSVELWRSGFLGVPAFEGNQFAEINAFVFGNLYQDINTTPGSTIRWRFAHRGRSGDDTIQVNIGSPGATVSQGQFTTGNNEWKVYSGLYTVPSGQEITRLEFEAVSAGSSSIGNFVDNISFRINNNCFRPELVLVKRITAINPGQTDQRLFNTFNEDGILNNGDNDPNWPNDDDTYLPGQTDVSDVKPGDEVEYTIYFLSSGDIDANQVRICDVIPDEMTFVKNTYGVEVGIGLDLTTANPPTTNPPSGQLSNLIGDEVGSNQGAFYAPGTTPPAMCDKIDPNDANSTPALIDVDDNNNISGAVWVQLEDALPPVRVPGAPINSYGFVRFRAKVK